MVNREKEDFFSEKGVESVFRYEASILQLQLRTHARMEWRTDNVRHVPRLLMAQIEKKERKKEQLDDCQLRINRSAAKGGLDFFSPHLLYGTTYSTNERWMHGVCFQSIFFHFFKNAITLPVQFFSEPFQSYCSRLSVCLLTYDLSLIHI